MRLSIFPALGVAAWLVVSGAAAQTPADTRRSEDFPSVGGAMNRFLPPRQMVPDPAPLPNNASEGHPAGLTFRKSPLGLIYVDAAGRTLYQMRITFYRLRNADPALFCTGPCAKMWKALAAPPDAKPVGAWKVDNGANGPQWIYGKNPVFTYSGDKAPGDLNGHEFEDLFSAINYIPPVPTPKLPGNVAPLFVDHREYVLADTQGHPLYAYATKAGCKELCGKLVPFAAALGNRPVGEWTILPGDRAQWAYRGKPVFVGQADTVGIIDPAGVLRP